MALHEEDWFYDSISRYKNLNMFEMEYPVEHIELASITSICVSCSNRTQHQLLELDLPQKLTSQAKTSSGSAITSDTDLKIKCGTFVSSRIAHMKKCPSDHTVVASHHKIRGVHFYQLPTDDSDEIKKGVTVDSELEGAFIAVSDSLLVLTKSTSSPVHVIDINTGSIINSIPHFDVESVEETMSPVYVDSNTLALCNHASGQVTLVDNRHFKVINTVPGKKKSSWSFTTLHQSSPTSAIEPTSLGMVSDRSVVRVFDSRNWNVPYLDMSLDAKCTNSSNIQINFKPLEKSWISVSGFDGNVYVYKLDSEPEEVFVHDGHRHVEGFVSDTLTSSHLWVPNIDNLVISSAFNGTVHAWQFEESVKR